MTKIAIHQPHYFPWAKYLYKIKHSDLFIFLDNAQYTKNSFINRNKIKINGEHYWLTVPVLTKGRSGQLIKDVEVNWDRDWNISHHHTLLYNYAGGIKDKTEALRTFFLFNKSDKLIDWCIRSVDFLCEAFDIRTERVFESELGISSTSSERLADICATIGATVYLSGASGRNYLDETYFAKLGIKIQYIEWEPKSSLSALHFYLKGETGILE